jgi:hypothetical protein
VLRDLGRRVRARSIVRAIEREPIVRPNPRPGEGRARASKAARRSLVTRLRDGTYYA